MPKGLSDITGKHSIKAKINQIKNTSKNYMFFNIIDAGNKLRQFARITKMLTNHAPIGEFRKRFHLDGPQKCWACNSQNQLETRDHMVWECPGWIHPFLTDIPKDQTERTKKLYDSANYRTQLLEEALWGQLLTLKADPDTIEQWKHCDIGVGNMNHDTYLELIATLATDYVQGCKLTLGDD